MSLSTRAEPANLPARRHPELRVEQPDGSLLTLTEHLERNGTQPWTFPGALDVRTSAPQTPARRRLTRGDAIGIAVIGALIAVPLISSINP